MPTYWQQDPNPTKFKRVTIAKIPSANLRSRTQSENRIHRTITFADVDEVAEFNKPFEAIQKKNMDVAEGMDNYTILDLKILN